MDHDSNYVLRDVLHIIFNYLNYCDLRRAAQVSKYWNFTANLEEQKRGIQFMLLMPTQFVEENNDLYRQRIKSFIHKSLRIKPALSLYFVDLDGFNTSEKVTKYQNTFRIKNSCYIIFSPEILGIDNLNDNSQGGNIFCMFFPEKKSLQYDYLILSKDDIKTYIDSDADLISNKFFSSEGHKCIIIFSSDYYFHEHLREYQKVFTDKVLNCIDERYKRGTYSLWGVRIFYMLNDFDNSVVRTRFFAVSMSGSSLRSYSILLDCDLSLKDLTERLEDFKKNIHINSKSQVLLSVPFQTCDENKINVFKTIFQPLICCSITDSTVVFGVDSTSESQQNMQHENSYGLLIVTC